MLVLTRRPGESLLIGDGIEVQVVRIDGDRVVIGIVAPSDVTVVRSELVRGSREAIAPPVDGGEPA
jgi:carbon storage regulator